MLRIAFFGLPLAALLLRRDGHEIVLAAVCRRRALGVRRLVREIGFERVLLVPRAEDLVDRVRALAPDLVVSWFWTKKLPMEIPNAARLGGVGVHPSLLPRHRGPDPTYWTIVCGDVETGVTAHRIERDYDTGAILAQERLVMDPEWNAWQLARALDRPSLRVLREVVGKMARGEPVPEVPQEESLATAAPFPTEDETWIVWSSTTDQILRQVRALAPAPGAATSIGEVTITVVRADAAPSWPRALEPGQAASIGGRALVRTGDGAVVLLQAVLHDGDGERVLGPTELAALVEQGALSG